MSGRSTTLNMTKNFINGHIRTSQICMKIPQTHSESGIQYTQKADIDDFKIDGNQSQELKEDHFGTMQKRKLSTL
jgi:hypothetical protein